MYALTNIILCTYVPNQYVEHYCSFSLTCIQHTFWTLAEQVLSKFCTDAIRYGYFAKFIRVFDHDESRSSWLLNPFSKIQKTNPIVEYMIWIRSLPLHSKTGNRNSSQIRYHSKFLTWIKWHIKHVALQFCQ